LVLARTNFRRLKPTPPKLGRLRVAADTLEERSVQPGSDIFREGNWFGVTKNLNGLAAGVYYDAAVGAVGKVLL